MVFIVFEGHDGTGKTTAKEALVKRLTEQGYDVYSTAEPTQEQFGKIFRQNLKKPEKMAVEDALVITIDRINHCKEIEKALLQGRVVACDRYLDSTIAYQMTQGLEYDWIMKLNRFLIIPDIVFLLDCDPDECMRRMDEMGKVKEKFEQKDLLVKIRNNYMLYRAFLMNKFNTTYRLIDTSSTDCSIAQNRIYELSIQKLLEYEKINKYIIRNYDYYEGKMKETLVHNICHKRIF